MRAPRSRSALLGDDQILPERLSIRMQDFTDVEPVGPPAADIRLGNARFAIEFTRQDGTPPDRAMAVFAAIVVREPFLRSLEGRERPRMGPRRVSPLAGPLATLNVFPIPRRRKQ